MHDTGLPGVSPFKASAISASCLGFFAPDGLSPFATQPASKIGTTSASHRIRLLLRDYPPVVADIERSAAKCILCRASFGQLLDRGGAHERIGGAFERDRRRHGRLARRTRRLYVSQALGDRRVAGLGDPGIAAVG